MVYILSIELGILKNKAFLNKLHVVTPEAIKRQLKCVLFKIVPLNSGLFM